MPRTNEFHFFMFVLVWTELRSHTTAVNQIMLTVHTYACTHEIRASHVPTDNSRPHILPIPTLMSQSLSLFLSVTDVIPYYYVLTAAVVICVSTESLMITDILVNVFLDKFVEKFDLRYFQFLLMVAAVQK